MQVNVYHRGFGSTPWMDEFFISRLSKLERFLSPSTRVVVELILESNNYITKLFIHHLGHDNIFEGHGVNFYESFSMAIEKSGKGLKIENQEFKLKINRRYLDDENLF